MPSNETSRATPRPAIVALAITATIAALVSTRPHLAGAPRSWSGDDLALEVVWWATLATLVWLGAIAMACVAALASGRTATALRIARWAPPFARGALGAALLGTWALAPAAAFAAPAPGVAPPLVVHVSGDGRLTIGPTPSTTNVPVVREPAPASATSTTAPGPVDAPGAPTSVPATLPPSATKPQSAPARPAGPRPAPRTTPVVVPARDRLHVVVPGDNLWRIAAGEVARVHGGSRPDDAQIAPYWRRVVAANRATLRSGDPSLIFPGEVVTLPPL